MVKSIRKICLDLTYVSILMGMWQSEKNARKYKIGRQYAITR